MVAYTLIHQMQSALPLPGASPVPSVRHGSIHRSDYPVSLKAPTTQQQASTAPAHPPLQPTTSTPAPRSQQFRSAEQQPLRPVRPTWEAAPWSPTRQLLSEPQLSLQEVLRDSAKLGGSQQITSQVGCHWQGCKAVPVCCHLAA